jgi:hypothetical protein
MFYQAFRHCTGSVIGWQLAWLGGYDHGLVDDGRSILFGDHYLFQNQPLMLQLPNSTALI